MYRSLELFLLFCILHVVRGTHESQWLDPLDSDQCKREEKERSDLDLTVYDHTFTFIADGVFLGFEQDLERFLKHHACAGRNDNQSVILEGRKATRFFTDYYGIDMSVVSDDDLLNGKVELADGKLLFYPFILNPEVKYRILSETSPCGSRHYEDALISDIGWAVEVLEPIKLNGAGYSGDAAAGNVINIGETMALAGPKCQSKNKIRIHYEAERPLRVVDGRFLIGKFRVHSDKHGDGLSYGFYDTDPETGKIAGREVLTFTRRK
ncbi:uncharacterized protein LOC106166270 [Lingula anatina]|uniref:Uncharacterized protein LOC106166270 n=1 Tax=Lingula anatina TaxID=7574 RepID=A0A1S3IQM6_LINAN|nr:uncharacterized protein LOC106166270 [Lingula anatina]|eukprot:XP_013400216.1 uncharacterized protein LOC106166270 [Lingula anatina]